MYYPGDYKYYLEQTEKNFAVPAGGSAVPEPVEGSAPQISANSGPSRASGTTEEPAKVQLSWEEQKRIESERRKKEKALATLEQQLATLEDQKKQLEQMLADPAVYSNGEKAKAVQHKIEELATQIEQVTEQWMNLSE